MRAAGELLGIDPLHVANEGKAVLGVRPEAADAVLRRAARASARAAMPRSIGRVRRGRIGSVVLDTGFGRRLRGGARRRAAAADLLTRDGHDDGAGSRITSARAPTGAVGYITIDRPERFNSLDVRTAQDLRRAGLAMARDASVASSSSGASNGVFCSGADLKYIAAAGRPTTSHT